MVSEFEFSDPDVLKGHAVADTRFSKKTINCGRARLLQVWLAAGWERSVCPAKILAGGPNDVLL